MPIIVFRGGERQLSGPVSRCYVSRFGDSGYLSARVSRRGSLAMRGPYRHRHSPVCVRTRARGQTALIRRHAALTAGRNMHRIDTHYAQL